MNFGHVKDDNNSARWQHPHQYPQFGYIKISQLVSQKFTFRVLGGGGFVSVHRLLQILSLSLVLLYAVSRLNNKWLLIVGREFFFCVLQTARQCCSHGSPWPSEEVPNGLCHTLSVDLSNTARAQTGLINELSENAFDTITRTWPWKSVTQPDAGFGPKNPWCSQKQNLTLKTHGQAFGTV